MAELFKHQVKQRTFIAATPEKVYDTITSADGWNAFFTTGLKVDPRPGGTMIWAWKDWGPNFYTLEVPAKVVEADKPRRFAFDWGSKMVSRVTFELEAKHGGTVVTVTEHGYPDTPEGRDGILDCASGWGEATTLLKFYIEHGITYTPPKKDA